VIIHSFYRRPFVLFNGRAAMPFWLGGSLGMCIVIEIVEGEECNEKEK
jgi:hypothetical protein